MTRKKQHRQPRRRPGGPKPDRDYWIYGRHAVLAALLNPARQKKHLIATRDSLAELEEDWTPEGGFQADVMSEREIEGMVGREAAHQGLALKVAPLRQPALEELVNKKTDTQAAFRLVLLDQVTDPRNAGAILRTAAAFGVAAVITTERNAAPETGALAKAASGALESVPYLMETNLARVIETLKAHNIWCLGLEGAAHEEVSGIRQYGRAALVLGAEGKGLRPRTADLCDALFRIPIAAGAMESLNVSAAGAIALYELAQENR